MRAIRAVVTGVECSDGLNSGIVGMILRLPHGIDSRELKGAVLVKFKETTDGTKRETEAAT
jgi:hypothetical protein